MANIIDYLNWRGDVPLSVDPFNEVDALILTELVYEDFSGIVPDAAQGVEIGRAAALFGERHSPEEIAARRDFTRQLPPLLELMGRSPRFAGTRLAHYHSVVDPAFDLQLAILSFLLPDGEVFVAYRGTDSTIVGWKEDFTLSYAPRTEGQHRAAEYLNERWGDSDAPLRVGGHSKGGNLAIYAAAKCRSDLRARIRAVYNNDGPGFLDAFLLSEDYRSVVTRILTIVPEDSLVGVLMKNDAPQRVVASSAGGIMQHDGFSWQVLGNRFVTRERRTDNSLRMEASLRQWLEAQPVANRKLLVGILFGLLEEAGIQTTGDLTANRSALISAVGKLQESVSKEQRATLWNMIGQLLSISTGMVIKDLRQELLSRIRDAVAPAGPGDGEGGEK